MLVRESPQGPSVDLLLIVVVVTIIGKRMCLPRRSSYCRGPAPKTWELERPEALGWSPVAGRGVSGGWGGWETCLPGSVVSTASRRQSSHQEQPGHSAGGEQIIHVAPVGLGKWETPWRLSPMRQTDRGVNAAPGAPVSQGSWPVVHFPFHPGIPAAVFA